MRLNICIALVLLGLTSNAAGAPGRIIRHSSSAVFGEYIVALEDRSPHAVHALAHSLAASYGGELIDIFDVALGGFAIRLDSKAAERLAEDPRVRFLEENAIGYISEPVPGSNVSATDSTAFNGQSLWYLDRIDARYPNDMNVHYVYCSTGSNVVVYVVDTGVWSNHPEIAGKVVGGVDFYNTGANESLNPCSTRTDGWHGTAVASVVAGTNVGVAKGAQIVSVRVGGCAGDIPVISLVGAMNWIAKKSGTNQIPAFRNYPPNTYMDTKRGVVNISGFRFPGEYAFYQESGQTVRSPSVELAVRDVAGNTPVITSANNFNSNACSYAPSNCGYRGPGAWGTTSGGAAEFVNPTVVTVGGTALVNNVDVRWQANTSTNPGSGSNSGSCVSLWAPAADVYAARHQGTTPDAFGNRYATASGTSFSSPIVAGVVARYLSQNPTAATSTVYTWLDANATKYAQGSTTARLVQNTATPTGADTPTHATLGPVGMVYWLQPCRVRP